MARNGHESRRLFDEQFVRCQDHLYTYIASLVPNAQDVGELFQQTSLQLLQNWEKYDAQRPFMPWACAVALNEVRTFARQQRHRDRLLSDALLAAISETQFKAAEVIDARLDALGGCVEGLPPAKRALVEKCYSGECSIKDMAASMSLPPQTLYKRLERVRRELFQCIELKQPGEQMP